MAKFNYDLFVIGTGEAGSTAAQICKNSGWSVAIADENPFGGTCSLRGCNPKRTLAGAAELLYRTRGMNIRGVKGSLELNWNKLIDFKDELTKDISSMHERKFAESGIDMFHGLVRFAGKNELSVSGKKISAAKILIATGSKPRSLGISGENNILTSDQMLNVRNLPSRIIFIGAGYISMEFAHVLSAAGANVILIEYASSPLLNFDSDLVNMLVEESEKAGIEIFVNSKITSIDKSDDGFIVTADSNGEKIYKADLVVHGAGRVPNVDRLMLECADINHDGYHIKVNKYLQSISNTDVYVAGDAHFEGIQLTPVAEIEGKAAAYNMIHGTSVVPDCSAVPSVIFTWPELAMAGKKIDSDDSSGDYQTIFQDTSNRHITRRLGISKSAFKIILEKSTGKICGAHLLGYNVDEVINLFTLAIRSGKTMQDLKNMPCTFPSVTYDTIFRM